MAKSSKPRIIAGMPAYNEGKYIGTMVLSTRQYVEFYLRSEYIWQRLRKCTSFNEIKLNTKGLLMLMRSIRAMG